MTLDERAALRQRLKEDVGSVNANVIELCFGHHIYTRVVEIIKANPRLEQPNPFLNWMFFAYSRDACISIRRLLDRDSHAVSLATIVGRIVEHPDIITREEFVRVHLRRAQCDGTADAAYDRFSSRGSNELNHEYFDKLLKEAHSECGRIKAFVDRHVAHSDRTPAKEWPKWKDLTNAVNAVSKLYGELHLLFHQVPHLDFDPSHEPDWEWIFREPWLPIDERADLSLPSDE